MYKLLPIIFLFYAKRLKKTDILQPVMKLSTSYSQILSLSVPIMLGSAAQNIIVLSDNVFLYHYDRIDFEASGLVGVFYLIIASIGYGFSRGGKSS